MTHRIGGLNLIDDELTVLGLTLAYARLSRIVPYLTVPYRTVLQWICIRALRLLSPGGVCQTHGQAGLCPVCAPLTFQYIIVLIYLSAPSVPCFRCELCFLFSSCLLTFC